MTAQPQVLKIRRPDDWHIHLRDDEMLKTVVPLYQPGIWPGDRDAEPGSPRNDRGRRAPTAIAFWRRSRRATTSLR